MRDFIEALAADLRDVASLAAVGFVVALGSLLVTPAPTWPIAVGRALSVMGLAVAGASILVIVPDLSRVGQVGVAAAMASLGTTGLELLFARILGGRQQ